MSTGPWGETMRRQQGCELTRRCIAGARSRSLIALTKGDAIQTGDIAAGRRFILAAAGVVGVLLWLLRFLWFLWFRCGTAAPRIVKLVGNISAVEFLALPTAATGRAVGLKISVTTHDGGFVG